MKRFLGMLLLLCATVAQGQNAENWASAILLCQDTESYHIQVTAYGDVERVYVNPSHAESLLVWEVGEAKQVDFSISLENTHIFLVFDTPFGTSNGDTLTLGEALACTEDKPFDLESYMRSVLPDVIPLLGG